MKYDITIEDEPMSCSASSVDALLNLSEIREQIQAVVYGWGMGFEL